MLPSAYDLDDIVYLYSIVCSYSCNFFFQLCSFVWPIVLINLNGFLEINDRPCTIELIDGHYTISRHIFETGFQFIPNLFYTQSPNTSRHFLESITTIWTKTTINNKYQNLMRMVTLFQECKPHLPTNHHPCTSYLELTSLIWSVSELVHIKTKDPMDRLAAIPR